MKRLAIAALLLMASPVFQMSAQPGCVGIAVHHGAALDDLIGGYCQQGVRIPRLVSKRTYYTPPPQFFSTRALYQCEGCLEQTAYEKGYDGSEIYVALVSSEVVSGWKVFIQRPDSADWTPGRVVDVVKREDEYLEAVPMHTGIELPYTLAKAWGGLNPPYLYGVKVCIVNDHPDQICTGKPQDFEQWYRSILSFEGVS